MTTPKQEVIEWKAGIPDTAYERIDKNYTISKYIERVKKVSWELRHTEIVKILKEIKAMREPELTDSIHCLKEAVVRFKLFPELNAAVTELKDIELLSKIREARRNAK